VTFRRDLLLRTTLLAGGPLAPRLAQDLQQIVALPEVAGDLDRQGFTVTGHGPDRSAALVRAEAARWPDVVRRAGARID
jgi:tripartite-type tricarboxylate transporter receptor subunit TctC